MNPPALYSRQMPLCAEPRKVPLAQRRLLVLSNAACRARNLGRNMHRITCVVVDFVESTINERNTQ
jgi:hypothetical protein